jgi:hypothetical protein
MGEETFTKYQTVEMNEEDYAFWMYIQKQKREWYRTAKIRSAEVKININSYGLAKFEYRGRLPAI